jgi:xanthine dehydrogenase accessory factor
MKRQRDFLELTLELLEANRPFVTVTVVDVVGSVPVDRGARMIVTKQGLAFGSVGGGRLEAKALEIAAQLLAGASAPTYQDWSLKSDIGMTCGGRVRLFWESYCLQGWPIVIFGAGHVTQALARLLATLPCEVTCIDPRGEWLERLPAEVTKLRLDHPAEYVTQLTDDCFILCMTRGHASDLPVLQRIYQSGRQFPYVGVIGSRAKAAVLRKELMGMGMKEADLKFYCPVGLPLGSNLPSEIAVSIAAQLLSLRPPPATMPGPLRQPPPR